MICDWDDIHQGQHRLDLFARLKAANPLFRCTLFAIPALGTDEFWNSIPDWCELAVHGWAHPHPREAENWTFDQAMDVLLAAPARFAKGFKAPGWQISDGTYEALLELGWWCADHPDNDARRPQGLLTHVLGDGDHLHGHIGWNGSGNDLAANFAQQRDRVAAAKTFELISEAVTPWQG